MPDDQAALYCAAGVGPARKKPRLGTPHGKSPSQGAGRRGPRGCAPAMRQRCAGLKGSGFEHELTRWPAGVLWGSVEGVLGRRGRCAFAGVTDAKADARRSVGADGASAFGGARGRRILLLENSVATGPDATVGRGQALARCCRGTAVFAPKGGIFARAGRKVGRGATDAANRGGCRSRACCCDWGQPDHARFGNRWPKAGRGHLSPILGLLSDPGQYGWDFEREE